MTIPYPSDTKNGPVQQGMIAVIFERDIRNVRTALLTLKYEYNEIVCTSFNPQITGNLGLEIVLVRGDATRIKSFEQQLMTKRGIRSARLTLIPS